MQYRKVTMLHANRHAKKFVWVTLVSVVAAGLAPAVYGQNEPPSPPPPMGDGAPHGPPDGMGPGGPDRRPEGERRGPEFRGGQEGGPGGPGGPGGGPGGPGGPGGGPGGPGGGPMGRPGRPMGAIMSYLDLVDRYSQLSSNPSASSVSAVVTLTDLLRPKGPQAVVDELNKMLAVAKDPAVVRAIRLQLIDWYRAAQQPEKAVEQAEILIGGSPSTQPSVTSQTTGR